MTPERWRRVDELLQSALSLAPEERSAFLEASCKGDAPLHRLVDEMLAAISHAHGFLEVPALEAAARAMASQHGRLSGSRIRHYRIQTLIGAGGMGEVYCARDEQLDRDVAIKVLSETGASSSARLRREARAAAALNHPNVCTVHEIGEFEGDAYIVMELIEGHPLVDLIAGRELEAGEVLSFSIEIAEAIAHAHKNGVVHGDIKPANIVVNSHRHLKVLDFGLAQRMDQNELIEMTQSASTTALHVHTLAGTLPYLAPEQYLGKLPDERSDVWSMGVVLFEMAAGVRPFKGRTTFELSAAILAGTPESLPPQTPPELSTVIQRCLSKDPAGRYPNASEVADALRQPTVRESNVQVAAPPLRWRRAATRRGVLAICGLLLFLLALAAALLPTRDRSEQSAIQPAEVPSPELSASNVEKAEPQPIAPPAAAEKTKDGDFRMFLLQSAGNADRPALSPDGVWIAFIQHSGVLQSLAIRQMTRAALEFRTMRDVEIVPAEPGVNLLGVTIEPDGRFIDYVRTRESRYELWQVPFLKGPPKLIIEDIDSLAGWSPNGQKMAFVRTDASGSASSLIVMDSRNGKEQVIATRNAPLRFLSIRNTNGGNVTQAPSWSPDGTSIALLGAGPTATGRGPHVVVVELAGGKEHLFALPAEEPTPAVRSTAVMWLNERTLILNRILRAGENLQLWRLSYPAGKLSRITNDVNNYSSLSISSGSKDIVSVTLSRQRDIWAGDAQGEVGENLPEAVTKGNRFGTQVIAWLGNMILGDNGAGERKQIFAFALPNGNAESLISQGSGPAATADGRTIVFISADRENPGLWKVDAQGLHRTRLAAGAVDSAVVTPDNRQVVFVLQNNGVPSLWTVSLEGGPPTHLVDGPVQGLDISRDGTLLLFGTLDPANPAGYIAVCELPGCTSRRRFTPPAVVDAGFKWMPDGRAFAYAAASDPANLWAQSLDGRAPYPVTHFANGSIAYFSWSHDGQRLAVLRDTMRRDLVLFKGLAGTPATSQASQSVFPVSSQ